MGSALTFLCNSQIVVTDLSYSYLYSRDLYPAVSNIYYMISMYSYLLLCMIRQLGLVHQYPFQYSYVCSSTMSVHPNGVGSARDTRVSLINVDMMFMLIKCCWMLPFPTVCRDSLQVVTVLFCAVEILHVRIER